MLKSLFVYVLMFVNLVLVLGLESLVCGEIGCNFDEKIFIFVIIIFLYERKFKGKVGF